MANFTYHIPEYPSDHVGEGKLLPGVQLIDKIEIAILTASSHDQCTVIHAAHKPGWTKALLGAVPFCAYWQLNASARELQQADYINSVDLHGSHGAVSAIFDNTR